MKKAAPAPHCFVKKFQHLVLLFLPCDSLQDLNRTSLYQNRRIYSASVRCEFLYIFNVKIIGNMLGHDCYNLS